MNKIICKLTGGHRYRSKDLETISEDDIYIFRHKCCKCGDVKEWAVSKDYFDKLEKKLIYEREYNKGI